MFYNTGPNLPFGLRAINIPFSEMEKYLNSSAYLIKKVREYVLSSTMKRKN
jgi:hypothetical protein